MVRAKVQLSSPACIFVQR